MVTVSVKRGRTRRVETNRGDLLLASAMRATGLTARALAKAIDVAPAVVSRWQSGNRQPRGPARALLRVLAREPEAALRALGYEPTKKRTKRKAGAKRTIAHPIETVDHVSADDAREGDYDLHLGYLGGQED